ncbi:prolipoprotein diacylglyceryl transferase [Opitutus sp. ER46]|uniref:prolipoprotein diacylglyceryl transferase n=1 Tax=Opitutus sp. ER46 TaxID=2161864 RepID=UPI000D302868|nr:prolipoprotein diacylglyceryl transferase [Opitutus sp. ER46]PTY00353.1 prolipoprotein diacylglyceryl transferase [Opitutus sp. ER46]
MSFLAASINGHWVHDLSPFFGPHWGNIGIRYYGLSYLLGFVTAWWLLVRYARSGRSLIPAERVPDLMVAIVLGVLVGGRLGYFLLYQPQTLLEAPLDLLRVWDGGMASHGGFIGVTIALAWFARSQKVPFLHVGDLVVSTAPAGLFFGRLANFINGELWGKVSDVSWAVIFPKSASPGMPESLILPRHPSQLYEAALEGLALFIFVQWRFWRSDVAARQPGRLAGEFLIAYAVVRAIGEVFREPDAGVDPIWGLSRGTFYSLFLVLAGLFLILRRGRSLDASTPKAG